MFEKLIRRNQITWITFVTGFDIDGLKLPVIVAKQIANRTRPDVTRIYRQSTIMSRSTFAIRKARDCVAAVSIFQIVSSTLQYLSAGAGVRLHNEQTAVTRFRYQFVNGCYHRI